MSKNPILNGLVALLYIIVLVLGMFFGTKNIKGPDPFLAPIAMISVFTLSAAAMGYLYCYQPIQLYFEGKKKQGTKLFLQTVGVFGGFTILILILLFLRVL